MTSHNFNLAGIVSPDPSAERRLPLGVRFPRNVPPSSHRSGGQSFDGDAVSRTALKMAGVILPCCGHRVAAQIIQANNADGRLHAGAARRQGYRLGCYPSLKAHTRRVSDLPVESLSRVVRRAPQFRTLAGSLPVVFTGIYLHGSDYRGSRGESNYRICLQHDGGARRVLISSIPKLASPGVFKSPGFFHGSPTALQSTDENFVNRFQITRSMPFHLYAWSLSVCANFISDQGKRHST